MPSVSNSPVHSRILYFDLLRIIACAMIVIMHSQRAGMDIPGWFLSSTSYLTAPGIGLFFMISGALILGKASRLGTAAELEVFPFLRHRLLKVAVPLAFWTLIYYLCSSIDVSGLGVMWFLWTISGLYLVSPILIRWLQHASWREVETYLALWSITLLYPFLKLLIPLDEGDTSWLYYFHGYVGYFVLGHYLSQVSMDRLRAFRWPFIVLFFLFTLIAPCAVFVFHLNVDFYSLFWYLSLPVVLQSVAWFLLFRKQEARLSLMSGNLLSSITKLSSLTFGIYLSHILVMRVCLWNLSLLDQIHDIPYLLSCALITFILAALLTWLIGKVPGGKWVIGG